MIDIPLGPVNLAILGLQRMQEDSADLITIWKTPYPVLTNYMALCRHMGIESFAGGTYFKQGPPSKVGYLTSGYRDSGGRKHSPHKFALAIDMAIGDVRQQIKTAKIARKYFSRMGLYPENGFVHLDLANKLWMKRYGGRRYWVCKKGIYAAFDKFDDMVESALK
jgi:hypothetical protein